MMFNGGYEHLTKSCKETFIFRLLVLKESKGAERGKQCQQFTQIGFSCLGEAELD